MAKKLTPWFPVSVNPARPGFYDIRDTGTPLGWRRYWNGSEWLIDGPTALSSSINNLYGIEWRGLAQEPK